MSDKPAKQRREVLMAHRELANAQRLLTEAMAKTRLAGDLLAKALDKDPDIYPPDTGHQCYQHPDLPAVAYVMGYWWCEACYGVDGPPLMPSEPPPEGL